MSLDLALQKRHQIGCILSHCRLGLFPKAYPVMPFANRILYPFQRLGNAAVGLALRAGFSHVPMVEPGLHPCCGCHERAAQGLAVPPWIA